MLNNFETPELYITLIPYFMIGLPLAIGNYFLADRLGKNKLLWVLLSIIPIFNSFFLIYIGYVTVIHILDRLAKLSEELTGQVR
ncbi:hypothetical protein [Blastochloris viridis]|uniref:Uncharacterized protein n=1 Tax=Blastochloris viridis TaxID=1079 RepID=A0A0H5B6Y3_BLAVI|nr:hypothetical protein [Blastochloris viridis]ALK08768.1 hypothetical protein BVIR_977 [Blastochloris viridis]BAR97935.1 hypothetical protein BV133_342 [Blastochloris viridis]CUU41429.1 hypothetical protein BVIRIDIS_04200 [Blastochloris viridis]